MTPVVPPYRRGGGFGSLGLRFREVVEPPPVTMAPETLGAWLTLAALVLGVALLLAGLVWRHHRRRYRRAAERELEALGAAWAADHGAPPALTALTAVPVLLKRCALQSFTRQQVAALSGSAWLAFLDATGGAPFGEAAGRALIAITTRGARAASEPDVAHLFGAARTWIRRHRAGL